MKKKILTLLIYILLFSIILTATVTKGQKMINKEKMSDIPISTNNNNPPNPPVIYGPKSGLIKETYIFYFNVTDPDEDDKLLTLEIEWGDGSQTETCGCNIPWENGEIIEVEHRWRETGNYEITARVADVYNYWSEWSDPYPVSIPKAKIIDSPLILRSCKYFPLIVQLLQI